MGTKNMKRKGKYPLYFSQREKVLDNFDEFCERQQTRIQMVFALQEEVRNEWKWVKEWVGKEGMELQEVRR